MKNKNTMPDEGMQAEVEWLLAVLQSGDTCERVAAANGLTMLEVKTPDVISALEVTVLEDSEPAVREAARFALVMFGHPVPLESEV